MKRSHVEKSRTMRQLHPSPLDAASPSAGRTTARGPRGLLPLLAAIGMLLGGCSGVPLEEDWDESRRWGDEPWGDEPSGADGTPGGPARLGATSQALCGRGIEPFILTPGEPIECPICAPLAELSPGGGFLKITENLCARAITLVVATPRLPEEGRHVSTSRIALADGVTFNGYRYHSLTPGLSRLSGGRVLAAYLVPPDGERPTEVRLIGSPFIP